MFLCLDSHEYECHFVQARWLNTLHILVFHISKQYIIVASNLKAKTQNYYVSVFFLGSGLRKEM